MTKVLALRRCRELLRNNGLHTTYRPKYRRPYVRVVDRHKGITLVVVDCPSPAEREQLLVAASLALANSGGLVELDVLVPELRMAPPYFDGRATFRVHKICGRCGRPIGPGESYGTINGRWEHLAACGATKSERIFRLTGSLP